MPHIHDEKTRTENTAPEWLGVGRVIGELANKWATRTDLVAYIGVGAGSGSPACYIPHLSEIEIDIDVAFGKNINPRDLENLDNRKVQYENAKGVGAIYHEAFHARFSNWKMQEARDTLPPAVFNALMLLEEGRIEACGVRVIPKSRSFLRSCAMDIVVGDAEEKLANSSDIDAVSFLVACINARVVAGTINKHEVQEVLQFTEDYLGAERVALLCDIARRFQKHEDHYNAYPLYPLAYEWVEVLKDAAEEKGEEYDENGSGSGSEASSTITSEMFGQILEKLQDSLENVLLASNDELFDQEVGEDRVEEVEGKNKKAEIAKKNREVAEMVFGKSTSESDYGSSMSTLVERRKPSSEERVAAVTVARLFEKARYRDRSEIEVSSETPPGRLRTRGLVQSAALKSRGVGVKTEPWRRTVRKQVNTPELTVGVMVDISGSMRAAMEPMATTAWVLSEATRRVQGRCAMVYYGNSVFSTLRPGEYLSEVAVYAACDSTEKFDKAFRALDGSLNLLNGHGARLLVVTSDGIYTESERAAAQKWVEQCSRSGVAVLWLPFSRANYEVKKIVGKNKGTRILDTVLDPASAAHEIGRSAAEALTALG